MNSLALRLPQAFETKSFYSNQKPKQAVNHTCTVSNTCVETKSHCHTQFLQPLSHINYIQVYISMFISNINKSIRQNCDKWVFPVVSRQKLKPFQCSAAHRLVAIQLSLLLRVINRITLIKISRLYFYKIRYLCVCNYSARYAITTPKTIRSNGCNRSKKLWCAYCSWQGSVGNLTVRYAYLTAISVSLHHRLILQHASWISGWDGMHT